MSQDEFAVELRKAGADTASKRLVQRWESGETSTPRGRQARALEMVTGLPIEALGFNPTVPGAEVAENSLGGHDVERGTISRVAAGGEWQQAAPRGNYSGIWLSRYEYFSSGRSETFAGLHYVVLVQHGNRLTVRSLADSANSTLNMDMTVDGSVLTGTWVEATDQSGYYRGARYHGAIQMLAEPTGRRIVGKWVGFGKDMDINSGPWELTFQDSSTSKTVLEKYNRRPDVEEE